MKHIELSPILEKVIGSIGVQLGPHQQPAQEDLNKRHLFDNQPDDMIGVDRACVVKHHPTPLLHQCSHLGFLIISRSVLNRATFSLSLTSPIRKTTGWPSGRTKRSSFMPHRGSYSNIGFLWNSGICPIPRWEIYKNLLKMEITFLQRSG